MNSYSPHVHTGATNILLTIALYGNWTYLVLVIFPTFHVSVYLNYECYIVLIFLVWGVYIYDPGPRHM